MELNVELYRHYPIVTYNGRKCIMLNCHIQWGIVKIPVQVGHAISKNTDSVTLKLIELNHRYIILKVESDTFGNVQAKAWIHNL